MFFLAFQGITFDVIWREIKETMMQCQSELSSECMSVTDTITSLESSKTKMVIEHNDHSMERVCRHDTDQGTKSLEDYSDYKHKLAANTAEVSNEHMNKNVNDTIFLEMKNIEKKHDEDVSWFFSNDDTNLGVSTDAINETVKIRKGSLSNNTAASISTRTEPFDNCLKSVLSPNETKDDKDLIVDSLQQRYSASRMLEEEATPNVGVNNEDLTEAKEDELIQELEQLQRDIQADLETVASMQRHVKDVGSHRAQHKCPAPSARQLNGSSAGHCGHHKTTAPGATQLTGLSADRTRCKHKADGHHNNDMREVESCDGDSDTDFDQDSDTEFDQDSDTEFGECFDRNFNEYGIQEKCKCDNYRTRLTYGSESKAHKTISEHETSEGNIQADQEFTEIVFRMKDELDDNPLQSCKGNEALKENNKSKTISIQDINRMLQEVSEKQSRFASKAAVLSRNLNTGHLTDNSEAGEVDTHDDSHKAELTESNMLENMSGKSSEIAERNTLKNMSGKSSELTESNTLLYMSKKSCDSREMKSSQTSKDMTTNMNYQVVDMPKNVPSKNNAISKDTSPNKTGSRRGLSALVGAVVEGYSDDGIVEVLTDLLACQNPHWDGNQELKLRYAFTYVGIVVIIIIIIIIIVAVILIIIIIVIIINIIIFIIIIIDIVIIKVVISLIIIIIIIIITIIIIIIITIIIQFRIYRLLIIPLARVRPVCLVCSEVMKFEFGRTTELMLYDTGGGGLERRL